MVLDDKQNGLVDETLKKYLAKESQFNAKVRFNMQVKALESEIEKLKERL